MKKNWFYNRLLIAYIPIIFSVCTILVLLIVIGFNLLSREATKKESLIIAQYVMAAIDNELKAVEQAVDTDLLNKSKFIRLFQQNPTTSAYQDIYELSVKLRETKFNYPVIDSLYVYRNADQTVQSMHGAMALDRFGDRDFVEYAIGLDNRDETPWGQVRVYQEFKDHDSSEVMSLVRSIPYLDKPGGVLVVNVSTEYLRGLVGHLTDLNKTYIAINDPQGHALLEAGSDAIQADAVYESAVSGYTIRLGFREGALYGIINTIMVLYVVIGAVVLLLALVWAVYMTRQASKPVHTIMEQLIEQSAQFERQQKENAVFHKRMFYAELREGYYDKPPGDLDAKLAEYGWGSERDGFMIAVVEIDGFEEFTQKFNQRDQSLLKFAINNVFMDISQQSGHPLPWADWLSGNQIALLYPVNKAGEGSHESVTKALNEAIGWIDQHLKMTVSIGIGSPVWEASRICESYEEALQMLKLKFSLGTNRIIGHWEVERVDRFSYIELLTPTRELVRSFCTGKADWPEQFELWFAKVDGWIAMKEDIDRFMYSLIYYFRLEVSQMSAELQELWRQEYDSRLEFCVQQGRSIREIGHSLHELLAEVDGRFGEIRERSGYFAVLQEVRAYIDENYSDPELSLELLSSTFHLNAKTLSRLFKEQFGINFVDYLIKTRIEHSKQLLLQSDETIQNISRKVGYQNSLSFTRAFKKIEGVTPVDLRRAELL